MMKPTKFRKQPKKKVKVYRHIFYKQFGIDWIKKLPQAGWLKILKVYL